MAGHLSDGADKAGQSLTWVLADEGADAFGDASVVLIVDDDPPMAEVLSRVLTRAGYRCTVAADAVQARARLAERQFAVALVDLMLPGEPGLDLITDVLPRYADLAVVIVSGVADDYLAEVASRSGVFGYVVKPFQPRQLLLTVANALHQRGVEIERRIEREQELQDHQLALAFSEATWRMAFASAPVAIVELALDGTISRANGAMESLLEVAPGQLEGVNLATFGHPGEGGLGEQRITALARGEGQGTALRHLVTARGRDRWANALGLLIPGLAGQPDRILDYLVDCTVAHGAQEQVAEAQARFSALVEHSADAIIVQDTISGTIVYASPGVLSILGLTPTEAIGMDLGELVHPDDLAKTMERRVRLAGGLGMTVNFDCRLHHADGSWRHLEITTTNLIDDAAVRGVVHNLHDVTDRVEAAARLAYQVMHDALTGLPNRALFLDRLDQALARATRSGKPCALLFMDLDHFKQVNDTLGHVYGDRLLEAVADRLRHAIRPGDSVARLGGDEFVVLAEDIDGPGTALAMAERIRSNLAQPVMLDERAVTVNCSIGVALSNRHAPDALVKEADLALYRAKQSGGNRWELYDRAMRARARRRLEVEDFIRAAIDDNLVVLHFQPIIDLASRALAGAEALAHIRGPRGTVVGPEDFIPVAEGSGLIVPLGGTVLDLACAQQARWSAAQVCPHHVAVNVSARQLSGPEFARRVSDSLASYDLDPEQLCIELTESTLIELGSSTEGCLDDLKAIGVSLAIDDFGTGWSSLSYLRRFPLDMVKIDRSFVAGLGRDNGDTDLVKAVVDLGHTLGLTTIAEGVESEQQHSLLCDIGCNQAQGYLYGRPRPAD